jgi:hypothetical protein
MISKRSLDRCFPIPRIRNNVNNTNQLRRKFQGSHSQSKNVFTVSLNYLSRNLSTLMMVTTSWFGNLSLYLMHWWRAALTWLVYSLVLMMLHRNHFYKNYLKCNVLFLASSGLSRTILRIYSQWKNTFRVWLTKNCLPLILLLLWSLSYLKVVLNFVWDNKTRLRDRSRLYHHLVNSR